MRGLAILLLVACGASPAAPPATPADDAVAPRPRRVADDTRLPIDPIAALAPIERGEVSAIVPGRILLELGGLAIEAPGGNRAIDVTVVDRQGNLVRVVVRLEHVRFSVWAERTRLLAVVTREQRVRTVIGGAPRSEMVVSLRPGARVRKLAHSAKDKQTQVRYVGAVEVEGWMPDDALAESAPARDRIGRIPSRHRTLMVIPGSIIRVEPRWGAGELATVANSHFLDTIKEIDESWVEVGYSDGEVTLRGYVSKRAPPGRVHRTRDPDVPPPLVVPNAKVASGTCLHSSQGGEPIGYIVGDRDVHLEDIGAGWWELTVDTPWGPVPFAARGPTQASIAACAPANTVPPPATRPVTSP